MIRILILALALLSAFACQQKDNLGDGGINPLNEVSVSESAKPGEEAVVQWNGFGSSPEIWLRDSEGADFSVEISVLTSSGLIFRIPHGIMRGTYTIMLGYQDEERILGKIEILAADMPITGLNYPAAVELAKDFIIEGVGFDENFRVVLSDGGSQSSLECTLVQGGLRVNIPESFKKGKYSLYLYDGVSRWLLSEDFYVSVRKKLSSISMTSHAYGDISVRTKYEIETEGDLVKSIVFSSVQLEGGEVSRVDTRDRYVLGEDGVFRAENGESSSNNFDFGYNYDNQGRIVSADVRRYSRTNPDGAMRTFLYVYNPDGTLSKVTYQLDGVTRSMQMWFYEEGNIVEMKASTTFAYEDESLRNNPFAQDFAMAYAALSDTMEPFIYAPYLIGKHPFVSRLLPSALYVDPGNGVKNKVNITYVHDSDGYMVKAEMKSSSTVIEFTYQ